MVRDFMIGCGYQEVLSYVMSSAEIQNHKMLRERPIVTTSNPKSRDYSVLRNSLLPILMDFISKNQHADYPQKIFEAGYIVVPDNRTETRTLQIPSVSGLVTDTTVNLTELMTELGYILRNMELDGRFEFKVRDDPTFIDGRCGVIIVDDVPTGIFGEISPQVLDNFELGKPVVAFELILPLNGEW
jgi:phenylalanyl-tRNA synthetase beta chain